MLLKKLFTGQIFLSCQCDTFLLEVGFLAIFFHSNFNEKYEDEINVLLFLL